MKILLLDIETAPILAAVWGLWDQNVNIDRVLKPGYTLCWAAKWYGSKEIMFSSIMTGHKSMIRQIHKLMSEADAICHYNGKKFDVPTLNREFLLMGLAPPSPSAQIDLLQVARTRFRLASNKMDYVAQQLGLGKKLAHKGFDLWLECMSRKKEAWQTMKAYNIQDVVLLEKIYVKMLPWIQNHPNWSVLNNAPVCPNCGGTHSTRQGLRTTRGGQYRQFQCKGCGTWHRSTKAEKRAPERRTQA